MTNGGIRGGADRTHCAQLRERGDELRKLIFYNRLGTLGANTPAPQLLLRVNLFCRILFPRPLYLPLSPAYVRRFSPSHQISFRPTPRALRRDAATTTAHITTHNIPSKRTCVCAYSLNATRGPGLTLPVCPWGESTHSLLLQSPRPGDAYTTLHTQQKSYKHSGGCRRKPKRAIIFGAGMAAAEI